MLIGAIGAIGLLIWVNVKVESRFFGWHQPRLHHQIVDRPMSAENLWPGFLLGQWKYARRSIALPEKYHTRTHKPWAAAYKTEKKKNWPKTSQIDLSTKSIKKKDKLVRFMENYSKIFSIYNIYNMNINSIARSTYTYMYMISDFNYKSMWCKPWTRHWVMSNRIDRISWQAQWNFDFDCATLHGTPIEYWVRE